MTQGRSTRFRAVGIDRVGDRIGLVPYSLLAKVDEALRIHLDLD